MDILRDLLLNGFMIYQHNDKFFLKKESVPSNSIIIKELSYDSYDLAIEAATQMLSTPQIIKWTAIVRYNRGLGIEYRNICDISASDRSSAKNIAKELADIMFDGMTIIHEIRVYIKNKF